MNIQNFYKPFALLSIISLLLASTITAATVSADSSDAEVPPGQLTRRGVSGTVVGVGGGSIVVETKFGNVTIDVDSGTIIKSKGDTITLEDINVGDRAGVLLNKAPDAPKDDDGDPEDLDLSAPSDVDDTSTDPDVTSADTSDDTSTDPDVTSPDTSNDTSTDPDLSVPSNLADTGTETEPAPEPLAPSFRQDVTALRITIVPSKATRQHECVVVAETGDGTTTVLDEEGNETELEGDEGTAGEDVCLITKTGRGGGKKITGSTSSSTVDDRLTRLAEKNEGLAEKLAEKKAEQEVRREERLEKTVGNAPEDKKGAAQGAKDKNTNRGSGGSGSSGSGSSGSGGSGDSGSGNSGGGNSGNSGGGKPDDKGSGKDKPKGKP